MVVAGWCGNRGLGLVGVPLLVVLIAVKVLLLVLLLAGGIFLGPRWGLVDDFSHTQRVRLIPKELRDDSHTLFQHRETA